MLHPSLNQDELSILIHLHMFNWNTIDEWHIHTINKIWYNVTHPENKYTRLTLYKITHTSRLHTTAIYCKTLQTVKHLDKISVIHDPRLYN